VLYQTAAQLRGAFDALADTGKFPDATIEGHLAAFDAIAVDYRGVAFATRSQVDLWVLRECDTSLRLSWPKVRAVTSVTVTSPAVNGTEQVLAATEYTVDELAGVLYCPAGFAAGDRVAVAYTHGLGYRVLADGVTASGDATVTSATGAFTDADLGTPVAGTGIPSGSAIVAINSATSVELSAAATATGTGVTLTLADPLLVQAAREYVRSSSLSGRSGAPRDIISQSVEGLTTRFSTPDKANRRPTGYLDVDRLLNSLPDYRAPF